MNKIFLDANILIDLIESRKLEETGVHNLLKDITDAKIYVSALSIHIAFYVLHIKAGSKTHQKASLLLEFLNILPLTESIISRTNKLKCHDYEDTQQYLTALDEGCDYILTRDKKDFDKIKKIIPSNMKIVSNVSKMK